MNTAYLALGSNLGDRKENLVQALTRIAFSNQIASISDVYETYGMFEKRDPYLNCCVEIKTDMSSHQLMQFLIEAQNQLATVDLGRHEEQHTHLDCDLISFNDEIVRTPQMTIPHPEAHRRAFVMIPLAQINPSWIHPILKQSAEELAKKAFWQGWGSFFANGKSLLDF